MQRLFRTGGPCFGRFVLSLCLLCLRFRMLRLRLLLCMHFRMLRLRLLLLRLRFRRLCLRLLLRLRFRMLGLCLLLHSRLRLPLLRLWLFGKIELQRWQVGELFRCRNPLVFLAKPCFFVFVSIVIGCTFDNRKMCSLQKTNTCRSQKWLSKNWLSKKQMCAPVRGEQIRISNVLAGWLIDPY